MSVSFRTATMALVTNALLAFAARWLSTNSILVSMLRVAFSSTTIAFVPGALCVIAWHPRRSFNALEWAGLALAVSLGGIELLTIAAFLVHWSPVVSLVLLALVIAACAARAARREGTLDIGLDHLVIVAILALLAVFEYSTGSRWDTAEDKVHIAIIERLAYLAAPSFRNIYFSPGIVYTYPFPGTHYLLALIARLGDLPAIFVYVKMRAFWGVTAIVLLYGCALLIFENRRIAFASTLVAAGFVVNGAFGPVLGMYWGQMAPFSHASDVAMGVLLPALLFLTCEVLRAKDRAEFRFSMIATTALTLMLIIVHIREIAQFVVYLAAFALALVFARGPRPLLTRTLGVLGVTIALLIAYRGWNASAVPLVDALVEGHKIELRDLYHRATWADLFGPPYPLMGQYMQVFEPFFYGWNPLVLLASPLILFAVRGKKLAWLIAASITSYMLIIRFPALAIPYTYATYFEILFTPVRNVIFFVHMLAGVGVYLLAAQLSRLGYVLLVALAMVIGVAMVEGMHYLAPVASQHIDVLFVPILLGYTVYLGVLIWNGRKELSHEHVLNPRPRWIIALLIMVAIVFNGSRMPEAGVVASNVRNPAATPAGLIASMRCSRNTDCPPPALLIQLSHIGLPTDSILAADLNEDYQPALFMPQQMVTWTGALDTWPFLEPGKMFPRYFDYLKSARVAGADQPLFNRSESHEQRAAFLRDLSVTHVLLDPPMYETMKPIFDGEKDLLATRYDDGHWALYEVKRP
jgi:hypothetical protein